MRRAITILKSTPAALSVLLLVAWISNFFIHSMVTFPVGSGYGGIIIQDSTLNFLSRSAPSLSKNYFPKRWHFETYKPTKSQPTKLPGVFHWQHVDAEVWTHGHSHLLLPIPPFILLIAPFAIAPLTRFRLPLWSWFAWTALLAGALKSYLNTSRPPI